MLRRIASISLHERHDRHAGLEPRKAEREFRKEQKRDGEHHQPASVLLKEAGAPRWKHTRAPQQVLERSADHDDIQEQIDSDDHHRNTNRLLETFEKHCGEQRQQQQREPDD